VTAASPSVEPAALPRTVLDRIRSGNLGSWPVIIALAVVVFIFALTAQNFFTPANFTNIITQMAGTCPARLRRRLRPSDRRDRPLGQLRQRVAGVIVAETQLPTGVNFPWYLCVFLAIYSPRR